MAPATHHHHHEPEARKRVPKACDRCRLKKVKCDGNMPCPRCKMEDAVCHFGARRKSIERPISTGYVDQIEVQQRILIKALKETWKRYAPTESKLYTGQEPSVHAIVRSLGVLDDNPGHRPVPQNFQFNESLTGTTLDMDTFVFETNSDISDDSTTRPSQIDRVPSLVTNKSGSSTSSRAQSEAASTHSSVNSLSPFSNNFPLKMKPQVLVNPVPSRQSSFSGKPHRPTFCPLPPRPSMAPVKPTRMDDWQQQQDDQMETGNYITTRPIKQEWQESVTELNASFTTPMDLDLSLPVYDESWDSWINEHPDTLRSNMLFNE